MKQCLKVIFLHISPRRSSVERLGGCHFGHQRLRHGGLRQLRGRRGNSSHGSGALKMLWIHMEKCYAMVMKWYEFPYDFHSKFLIYMGNEDGNDGVQFQQACFHLEKHTWKHVKSALRPWCCSRSVSLAMLRSSLMQSWRASATCPCLPSCLWCLWLVSLPPLALPRSWSQKCSHLTTWVQQDSSTIGPWQPGLWPCPSLPSLWLLSTCWSRWMVSRRTSERPGPSELLSKHEVHELHELHELQTSQNLLQKSTWSHQFNLHVIILLIQDFLWSDSLKALAVIVIFLGQIAVGSSVFDLCAFLLACLVVMLVRIYGLAGKAKLQNKNSEGDETRRQGSTWSTSKKHERGGILRFHNTLQLIFFSLIIISLDSSDLCRFHSDFWFEKPWVPVKSVKFIDARQVKAKAEPGTTPVLAKNGGDVKVISNV